MKECVIFWKSKITNSKGNGITKFTEEEAKRIVEDMNKKYPDILHWYEIVNS